MKTAEEVYNSFGYHPVTKGEVIERIQKALSTTDTQKGTRKKPDYKAMARVSYDVVESLEKQISDLEEKLKDTEKSLANAVNNVFYNIEKKKVTNP